jgi:hypothetical protein
VVSCRAGSFLPTDKEFCPDAENSYGARVPMVRSRRQSQWRDRLFVPAQPEIGETEIEGDVRVLRVGAIGGQEIPQGLNQIAGIQIVNALEIER